jgi:hypothetical protein
VSSNPCGSPQCSSHLHGHPNAVLSGNHFERGQTGPGVPASSNVGLSKCEDNLSCSLLWLPQTTHFPGWPIFCMPSATILPVFLECDMLQAHLYLLESSKWHPQCPSPPLYGGDFSCHPRLLPDICRWVCGLFMRHVRDSYRFKKWWTSSDTLMSGKACLMAEAT